MFHDYIVIEGFHVMDALKKGLIVYGDQDDLVAGVEVRNNRISGISLGSDSPPADNTSGVRIEWASDTLLRSNEIWDVYNPSRTTNANGISLYNTQRTTIEHNAIRDTIGGIKHKEASDDTIVRYNRIRCDGTGAALVIENQSSPINPPDSVSGRAEGFHFYQNVVRDCSNGVIGAGGSTTPIISDVRIYNNVFYGLTDIGVRAIANGTGRFVYNNVFHRFGHPPAQASGDVVTPHYGSELYGDLRSPTTTCTPIRRSTSSAAIPTTNSSCSGLTRSDRPPPTPITRWSWSIRSSPIRPPTTSASASRRRRAMPAAR